MLDIQLGRRNLSPIQRIAIAEKYRNIYEKQARENQLSGLKQNQNTVSQNSSKRIEPENKIDVRAKLAETAGVSTDTYSKGKKILDSDNKILKDLIETNIRQRGIGNPNPVKLGRCIKELERIYGVREGRPEKLPKVSEVNQSDIADMIGISVDTLNNYKKLTELIPELEDLVETGILAPNTALALVKYMSPSEQEKFVNSMDITKKITTKNYCCKKI